MATSSFAARRAATSATSDVRSHLIKKLHVLKRDFGLDDDLYRDRLERIAGAGKRSATQLNADELQRVVESFNGKPTTRPRPFAASPQAKMIQALWLSLWNLGIVEDDSDEALMAFVARQTKIEKPAWLRSQTDVAKVAEALKAWLAREAHVDFSARKAAPPWMQLPTVRICEAQWRILEQRLRAPSPAGLLAYAKTVFPEVEGAPESLSNYQWGFVSKKLGRLVRETKRRPQ